MLALPETCWFYLSGSPKDLSTSEPKDPPPACGQYQDATTQTNCQHSTHNLFTVDLPSAHTHVPVHPARMFGSASLPLAPILMSASACNTILARVKRLSLEPKFELRQEPVKHCFEQARHANNYEANPRTSRNLQGAVRAIAKPERDENGSQLSQKAAVPYLPLHSAF